jgi:hypothetical protein
MEGTAGIVDAVVLAERVSETGPACARHDHRVDDFVPERRKLRPLKPALRKEMSKPALCAISTGRR